MKYYIVKFLRFIFYSIFFKKKDYKKIFEGDKLLKKKDPYFIENIKEDISQQKLNIKNSILFNKLELDHDIELSVRQFMVHKFLQNLFHVSILKNLKEKKKIVLPIPSEWFTHIEKKNIPINRFLSKSLFLILVFLLAQYNFFVSLVDLFRSIKFNGEKINFKKSYYFLFVNESSINSFIKGKKYGVISSIYDFNKNTLFNNDDNVFYHSNKDLKNTTNIKKDTIKIKYLKNYLPNISNLANFIIIFAWLIFYYVFSIIQIFFNKWHYAIMLYEKYCANKIAFQKKINICSTYFYPHTNFIYKPLWAIELEKKGSKIIQYYYSISNDPYELNPIKYKYKLGFNLMTWKNYYAWDKFHKEFIISNCLTKQPNVQIFEPISFRFFDQKINLKENTVLIFDVQPHRYAECVKYRHPYYGDIKNLKWNNSTVQFIQETFEISNKNKLNIALKRKRTLLNYLSDKKYNNTINSLKKNYEKFYEINPEVDPHQLFEDKKNIKLVICLPFTSVGYIAKHLNINIIFYDPLNAVTNNIEITRDIPVIRSKNELDEYIKKLL